MAAFLPNRPFLDPDQFAIGRRGDSRARHCQPDGYRYDQKVASHMRIEASFFLLANVMLLAACLRDRGFSPVGVDEYGRATCPNAR